MYLRRWFVVWCAITAVCLCKLGLPAQALAQSEENIHFLWLFEAKEKHQPGDRIEHFTITQDTELKTGDALRMAVELRKPSYVYVIYHSAQGDMQQLFPYDKPQFDTHYTPHIKYLIPAGEDKWFMLNDKAGKETFYLLASTKRLAELEMLIETYTTASASERTQVAAQIIAAIRKLKRQHRQLASPAERPIPIAGNMRHDVKPTEIKAQDFYSKTFTIETTE